MVTIGSNGRHGSEIVPPFTKTLPWAGSLGKGSCDGLDVKPFAHCFGFDREGIAVLTAAAFRVKEGTGLSF